MKITLLIYSVLYFAGSLNAQETPTLKTEKDKISYGIGVGYLRNLQRQGIEYDLEMIVKGLRDASSGKILLAEEELQKTMNAFQAELQKKFQDAQKATAEKNKKAGDGFLAENSKKEGVVTLPSGLQYKILKAGNGKIPSAADTVEVNYRGTLIDGTEFDSSYKRGQSFKLKVDSVIPGWIEALKLMPAGSKWQLFIPPQLAYGEAGAGGPIGPNMMLIFEVDLLSVQ
jgi:FKBP-type peptidyl-prolyl cis-trans isomerase